MSKDQMQYRNNYTSFQPFSPANNPPNKSFFSSSLFSPRQPDNHSNKISQLHNKAVFFQGQLDELSVENQSLKSKVIEAQRQIQSSTQLLRNLLPEPSQVEKQIQLKLANLERVSEMIKEDWEHMQDKVKRYKGQVEAKKRELQAAQSGFKKAILLNEEKAQQAKQKYEQNIKRIGEQYQKKIGKLQCIIQKLEQERNSLEESNKNGQMQLTKYKIESQEKQAQYCRQIMSLEKLNEKLTLDIATMVREQQKNTKIIIDHYHELSLNKEKELKQNYEYVLKTRQQEYTSALQQLLEVKNSLNAKITQKEEQILQLLEVNGRYIKQKNEITQECERYKQSLTLEQNRVIKLNEELQYQNTVMIQNENQIRGLSEQKRIQFQELSNKNTQLIKKNSGLQIRMNKMKNKLEKELQSETQKYNQKKEENQTLSTQIAERNAEVAKLEKQIRQKNKEMEKLKELEKDNKQLRDSIKIEKDKAQITQKELRQYQNMLIEKEREFQQSKKEHGALIQKIKSQYDLQIEKVRKQNFESYGEKERKFQEYLDKISHRHALQLKEKEEAALEKQKELNEKLKVELENIKDLQQEKVKRDMEISKLQEAHAISIARARQELESEIGRERQKLRKNIQQIETNYKQKFDEKAKYYEGQMIERQRKNLQNLQLRQKEYEKHMKLKQIEFQNKLKILQEDMQVLKANNGMVALESHYSAIISKLREEKKKQKEQIERKHEEAMANVRQSYKLRLNERQNEHKKQMEGLELRYLDSLEDHKLKFERDIQKISLNLQQNIFFLDSELKNEKQLHHFTKLSTEQKIAYLNQKISSMKNKIERTAQQISQLSEEIEEKNKQLENVDKLVNEKIRKKKQEYELYISQLTASCERKIEKTISNCNQIVHKVQRQRVRFTEILSKQFEQIKDTCNSRIAILQAQYEELEKLFEERPSREEDMNKIKQLTLIKQKMDLEANQYKKRINDANQIVKYLNLQLENYKQVYDIFGPEGVTQNVLALKKREDYTSTTKNEDSQEETEKIRKLSLKETYKNKQSEKQKNNTSLPEVFKKRSIRMKTQMSTSQALKIRKQQEEEEAYFQDGEKKITTIEEDFQGEREQILENGEVVKHLRMAANPNTKYKYRKLEKSRSYINTDIQSGSKNSQNLLNQLKSKSALKHTSTYMKSYTQINQQSETSGNTQDIKTNAQIFLELLNSPLKAPPIEKKTRNNGYGKMSLNKRHSNLQKSQKQMRQIGVERIKKYQIMNRVVGLKN